MDFARLRRSLAGLALAAVPVVAVALARARRERATARRVDRLLAAASRSDRTVDLDALDGLPAPVRRYFETVLTGGQPVVSTVRLDQRGAFRLGDAWKPLRATQHYTVDPPGFVWDATVDVAPLLSIHVVDAYERGAGSLRADLLAAVPVASAAPSPAMNEGELLRYLAEAVWFPTALLPGSGVAWEAVDDSSARATLTDGDATASLVFHFDDDGLVERVSGERYRQETDEVAPWTGRFDAYEWHDGAYVPTEASVEWSLPDGPHPYWRGHITAIDHRREPPAP